MATTPALVLSDLHKTWRAGAGGCVAHAHALRGVDLEVQRGELVAVAGAGGAGKTTLLLCAAGIARADAGTVTVGGSGAIPDARRSAVYLDAAATTAASPAAPAPSAATVRRAAGAVHEPAPGTRVLLVDSLDRAADAQHAVARLRALAGGGVAVVAAARDGSRALATLRRAGARVVRLERGRLVPCSTSATPRSALELTIAPAGAADRLRAAGVAAGGSGDTVRIPLDGTSAEEILARCLALRVSVRASRVVRDG